ncbi:MAG: antibiotic biosynthesis monooxygenase, partial [Candidatus Sericytochromatia bacterium]|nr:antibiotic biosynthesis monooxygenase [Candidatus Tanganyikabacteria bacterium]
FIAAMVEDARCSVEREPGCVRFDIIQDAGDPNRIWVYEVYKDEQAFEHHMTTPHFLTWKETVKDWRTDGPKGALRGSSVIWPEAGRF